MFLIAGGLKDPPIYLLTLSLFKVVNITKDGIMCYDGIPDDNILVKSRLAADAEILKDLLKEKT